MNKILNFLQDASDLYITFTESQICWILEINRLLNLNRL